MEKKTRFNEEAKTVAKQVGASQELEGARQRRTSE